MGSKRLLLLFQICVVSICALSKSSLAADVNDSISKREVNCTAYYIEKALGVNRNSITVSVKCIFCTKPILDFFHNSGNNLALCVCVWSEWIRIYVDWSAKFAICVDWPCQNYLRSAWIKSVCLFFLQDWCVICRFFRCFNDDWHEFWCISIQLIEMVNKIIRFFVTFGRHWHSHDRTW